ncbi:MAG: tetratricopeptide repeat protein [Spirochaetaceae bacterium]|jgi:tetratricopeptide (TPR) repeat protein|nr:tetratricopeptide repeat protein [Spirochaetaceae bacterium]
MKYSLLGMLILLNQIFFSEPVFSQTAANSETAVAVARQKFYEGRDLESKNRLDEAGTYYSEAAELCLDEISRNARNEMSYVILTWTLQRQRKYAEVIEWGDRGLRVNPHNYPLIEVMGEAYFYLEDYDRSLRCMEHYADAVPRGDRISTAYFFIGEIYRLRKKYLHADIAYTTAVRLEPNLPLWWYRLGLVMEALHEYSRAVDAFERAIRLRPAYPEASQGLARVRKASGA